MEPDSDLSMEAKNVQRNQESVEEMESFSSIDQKPEKINKNMKNGYNISFKPKNVVDHKDI